MHCDDAAVALRLGSEAVGKVVGVGAGLAGAGLELLASAGVKLDHAVHLVGGGLSGEVAAALLCDHVDQNWADLGVCVCVGVGACV
jgi:hypothetical protein